MNGAEHVQRYIESLDGKKPGTIRQYVSDLKQFTEWLDARSDKDWFIPHLTTNDVSDYAEHLQKTARNPVTIKRHLSSVRQLLLFYGVTIHLSDKQSSSYKSEPLKPDDFISEQEMNALLTSIEKPIQSTARDALISRNLALVLFMREHALRPNDLTAITMNQVNLAQAEITLASKTITLTLQHAALIRDYLQSIDLLKRPRYHTQDPLFVAYNNRSQDYQFDYGKGQPKRLTTRSIQNMMTDEVRRAELRNLSAKHLRNSCILDYVATGQPDDIICQSVQLTHPLSLRRYKTYRASTDSLS